MAQHALLAPVLVLVLWTLVIFVWMYATRIPAMQKANMLRPMRLDAPERRAR